MQPRICLSSTLLSPRCDFITARSNACCERIARHKPKRTHAARSRAGGTCEGTCRGAALGRVALGGTPGVGSSSHITEYVVLPVMDRTRHTGVVIAKDVARQVGIATGRTQSAFPPRCRRLTSAQHAIVPCASKRWDRTLNNGSYIMQYLLTMVQAPPPPQPLLPAEVWRWC
jgi:hypothetical protein